MPTGDPTKPAPHSGWIEIRATTGKLLCRYDPFQNVVQFKHEGYVQAVELDRIREKYGVSVPEKTDVIIGNEVVMP